MAKKNPPKKAAVSQSVSGNFLPQNILHVGERVEEDKNIYISQPAYKSIHRFTADKTKNESGGMLIGDIIEEFGKTNIIISGFIEARHCESTPTTLKFTHETWEYCHKEISKKYPGKKIVGWIHTHPNFGIFLSEYDKFIHENFFKEDYDVAYVVDPIQNIEGFYFWINGKIERCKGFYIFDTTGKKISVELDNEGSAAKPSRSNFTWQNILLAALSLAVVILFFSFLSLKSEVSRLKSQQEAIAANGDMNFGVFQTWLNDLQDQISNLASGTGGSSGGVVTPVPSEGQPDTNNTAEGTATP